MAAAADPRPEELYDLAVPDAPNTLGGLHGDIDPEHPTVIGHMGECLHSACGVFAMRAPVVKMLASAWHAWLFVLNASLAGMPVEPPLPLAVKSLMPGQDLTRVTIPAFFLEPRSLLERMADTLMHPDLLLQAAATDDPVERMKGIVRWFLSGFHYKTTVRHTHPTLILCRVPAPRA